MTPESGADFKRDEHEWLGLLSGHETLLERLFVAKLLSVHCESKNVSSIDAKGALCCVWGREESGLHPKRYFKAVGS